MLILIAEDEAVVALTLALQLEESGHAVLGPASTIEKAEALAHVERPDLALLDIDLRHRGDGIELARLLKKRWRVPCLFMTGRPEAARAAADAALGVIAKPYDPADIDESVAVVESIIAGSPTVAGVPRSLELFLPVRSCSRSHDAMECDRRRAPRASACAWRTEERRNPN